MKHLRLDLYGVTEHAQEVMKRLGITYQHATPQSMSDSWWFWNCENVPELLPEYLKELTVKPHDAIGWGLSRADADAIAARAGEVLSIVDWNASVEARKAAKKGSK